MDIQLRYNFVMRTDVINIDPEIFGGTSVFRGTRVPIESLFDHLEAGVSLDELLDDFPSVQRQQAVELLELAGKLLTAPNLEEIYENIARWELAEEIET